MKWYSENLLLHGERLCKIASSIFNTSRPQRCTPKYHATHSTSPLNSMSLVSDLSSVLRTPQEADQPPCDDPMVQSQDTSTVRSLKDTDPAAVESSSANAVLAADESSRVTPGVPMTPPPGGSAGTAPFPSSWPVAQRSQAQHTRQLDTQTSSQAQQPVGLSAANPDESSAPMQLHFDNRTGSDQGVSSSGQDEAALISRDQPTQHHASNASMVSPAESIPAASEAHANGEPDTMQFRPLDDAEATSANSAAETPASALKQAQCSR